MLHVCDPRIVQLKQKSQIVLLKVWCSDHLRLNQLTFLLKCTFLGLNSDLLNYNGSLQICIILSSPGDPDA